MQECLNAQKLCYKQATSFKGSLSIVCWVGTTGVQERVIERMIVAMYCSRGTQWHEVMTSDVNKTKILRTRPEQQDQDQDRGFQDHDQDRAFIPQPFVQYIVLLIIKTVSFSIVWSSSSSSSSYSFIRGCHTQPMTDNGCVWHPQLNGHDDDHYLQAARILHTENPEALQ